jgi:TRAP-type mannitol/chloroaromatic compound transport system substrate-binding protein
MPLSNPSASVTVPSTSVAATALITATLASQTLMAGNSKRITLTIFNDSTANLHIDFGKAVSLTDYAVKIMSGGYYELPSNYAGSITGVWDAVNGVARIRDLSYS